MAVSAEIKLRPVSVMAWLSSAGSYPVQSRDVQTGPRSDPPANSTQLCALCYWFLVDLSSYHSVRGSM